jgi:hypothetical protein
MHPSRHLSSDSRDLVAELLAVKCSIACFVARLTEYCRYLRVRDVCDLAVASMLEHL